jgi:hypothetical protein
LQGPEKFRNRRQAAASHHDLTGICGRVIGRPEGPRCYCAVNNLLRKSLDSLLKNYAAAVVDNEAGMEHISRRTTNNVDFLLIVMNPTLPSARAAGRILALSHELPVVIGRRMLLINRIGPDGVPGNVEKRIECGAAFMMRALEAGLTPEDIFIDPSLAHSRRTQAADKRRRGDPAVGHCQRSAPEFYCRAVEREPEVPISQVA